MFTTIITTFNRKQFLKRAIKAVVKKNFKPKEIIIINNGLHKYKKKDLINSNKIKIKIKIINNKKNLFPAKARNKGANLANYNYLCFLDDDDKWEKGYLKEAKKIILKFSSDIILSKIFINNKLFKNPKNLLLNDILVKNPGITGSNIIIKRNKFLELGGYKHKLEPSEDKSIAIDAMLKKMKISFSNKKVFFSDHNQVRLTKNYNKLSNGTYNFYKRYESLMNLKEKIFVLNKVNIYRIKSFKIIYLPLAMFFFIINKFLN